MSAAYKKIGAHLWGQEGQALHLHQDFIDVFNPSAISHYL
jgi:hypothetical protein